MSLLEKLDLRQLTPARLWADLDAETKRLAVETVYDGSWEDEASRLEADQAIAATLRYRAQAVRKLPAAKRVGYLRARCFWPCTSDAAGRCSSTSSIAWASSTKAARSGPSASSARAPSGWTKR